ncbi:MAG TPA: hypothetical protein VK171_00355 [Fimbriimonas sp.]|nr:hypothetical protein [Fimbriimonas sp.]
MSIYLKSDVFVKIQQLEGEHAPRPLPLSSGFSNGLAYEVLGIHTASESAEAFLILRNDRDEMWFISNRHVRLVDMPKLIGVNTQRAVQLNT